MFIIIKIMKIVAVIGVLLGLSQTLTVRNEKIHEKKTIVVLCDNSNDCKSGEECTNTTVDGTSVSICDKDFLHKFF